MGVRNNPFEGAVLEQFPEENDYLSAGNEESKNQQPKVSAGRKKGGRFLHKSRATFFTFEGYRVLRCCASGEDGIWRPKYLFVRFEPKPEPKQTSGRSAFSGGLALGGRAVCF